MLTQVVTDIANFLRGVPFIVLLLGAGIYVTFRLGGIQFRAARAGLHLLLHNNKSKAAGDVSGFGALATVMAGTIGTGNIAGVATAIAAGGPGAVLWMWVTALFGMALKFASCTLAHHYRELSAAGEASGGPMYTLKNGLGMKWLGTLFALFVALAALTTGGMVQSHSVVDGIAYVIPSADNYKLELGIVIGILVAIVVLGGVKRIAHVASIIVPFMALAYCAAALVILVLHASEVPKAFSTIFIAAFNPEAVGGAAIGVAIQYGVVRALFASEAGLGTAAIGMAATKSNEPVEAGLIGMLGPWIDTLTICTLTALVIILAGGFGAGIPEDLAGSSLSAYAFENGLQGLGTIAGAAGAWIVGLGLVFFAYSTMLSWGYYGVKSCEFLWGKKAALPFRLIFITMIIFGALAEIKWVWDIADISNVLMAIPNLISILLLISVIKKLRDNYFSQPGLQRPL